MKILPSLNEYTARQHARAPFAAAHGYAAAVEALEAHADKLRAEYESAAATAPSAYHLGTNALEKAWKAEEMLAAATWLREQRHNIFMTPTPETDGDDRNYPLPEYLQLIQFEGATVGVIAPEDYEELYNKSLRLERERNEAKVEAETMRQHHKNTETVCANLQEELARRDAIYSSGTVVINNDEYAALVNEVTELRKTADGMKDVLESYHLPSCAILDPAEPRCDCGFNQMYENALEAYYKLPHVKEKRQ